MPTLIYWKKLKNYVNSLEENVEIWIELFFPDSTNSNKINVSK